jgi:hypothetical protein
MPKQPINPPYRRSCCFNERYFPWDGGLGVEPSSPVHRAAQRSYLAIAGIRSRLHEIDDSVLASVYLSGSLGRMEGRKESDWDLILVLRDDAVAPEELEGYGRSLWERLDPKGDRRPEPNGIFASPITLQNLADPRHRGTLSDTPTRFGKRMQLLLDAAAIWGDYDAGREAALRFYGLTLPRSSDDQPTNAGETEGDGREGIHLFNDLIRYHRSLCAMTMWLQNPESDKTRRLKLKLCFSRFLNYLGLLLPLALGIDRGSVAESLGPFWNLTPLERVLEFANEENNATVEAFCRSYEAFLAFLEKPAPSEDDWSAIDVQADRFRESACELLRSQLFLQRGRAADLLLL